MTERKTLVSKGNTLVTEGKKYFCQKNSEKNIFAKQILKQIFSKKNIFFKSIFEKNTYTKYISKKRGGQSPLAARRA